MKSDVKVCPKEKGLRRILYKHKGPYLFVIPAIFFYCVFILYPIIENVRLSFYQWTAISSKRVFVGLDNFIAIVNDPIFWLALYHNLLYLIGSVSYIVLVGLLLALALNSPFIRFKKVFRSIFFLPNMICTIAVGLLWGFIYQPMFGFLNTFLEFIGLPSLQRVWLGDPHTALGAIIWAANWASVGFAVIVFLARLATIPAELYEAAEIDGAKRHISFFYITLPQLKEALILVVLFFMIMAFNNSFAIIFIMTYGGPAHSTEVLTTWMYTNAFNYNRMGYGCSLATVILVIIFVASFLFLKFTRSGEVMT